MRWHMQTANLVNVTVESTTSALRMKIYSYRQATAGGQAMVTPPFCQLVKFSIYLQFMLSAVYISRFATNWQN